MSLGDLAQQVHYSKSYLSRIENGERDASEELARSCDDALKANGELTRAFGRRSQIRRGLRVRPAQLPALVPGFVGRTAALAELHDKLDRHGAQLVVVSGPPGVGKTALATRWAQDVSDAFPDGVLFADLNGFGPGSPRPAEEVLATFLLSLGVSPDHVLSEHRDRAALFRSVLSGRRVLTVLDNAATPSQVRPLIPGSPGCVVLVTSRNRMAGLAARDGAVQLVVDPLTDLEADQLLGSIVGVDRVESEARAAALVAEQCGRLPLALRIAAERAAGRPGVSLGCLVEELRAESGRLDALAVADDEGTAMRTVFSWSYRTMADDVSRMFRLLGLSGLNELGIGAVAALAAVDVAEARRLMDALLACHLVEQNGSDRYRLHDLVRVYALELSLQCENEIERVQAHRRLRAWYLHGAVSADRKLAPHRPRIDPGPPPPGCHPQTFDRCEEAIGWCDQEVTNALSVAVRAGGDDPSAAWQVPVALWTYFHMRHRWTELMGSYQAGLAAARRCADRGAEVLMLQHLGDACRALRRHREGLVYLDEALEILREHEDGHLNATVLNSMASMYLALSRVDEAVSLSWQSLNVLRALDDQRGEALVLNNLGEAYRDSGQFEASLRHLDQAYQLFETNINWFGQGVVLHNLGRTYQAMGQLGKAIEHLRRAVALRREIGDRRGEAGALNDLGDTWHAKARDADADVAWRQAFAIFDDIGDLRASDVLAKLRRTDAAADSARSDRVTP